MYNHNNNSNRNIKLHFITTNNIYILNSRHIHII